MIKLLTIIAVIVLIVFEIWLSVYFFGLWGSEDECERNDKRGISRDFKDNASDRNKRKPDRK